MVTNLFLKTKRKGHLTEASQLRVARRGIEGNVAVSPIRQVLIVPFSTLLQFQLRPGDLRENIVIDDSLTGNLHEHPSGTVLEIGCVLIRLTVHCEPCYRIKDVVNLKAIEHKRGYFGAVLKGGTIEIGDKIRCLQQKNEAIPYDIKERLRWYLARLTAPVQVTRLVHEIGVPQSYCRVIPNLLRDQPEFRGMVLFRGRRN